MKIRKNKTKRPPSNAPVFLVLLVPLILFGEAVSTEAQETIVYRDKACETPVAVAPEAPAPPPAAPGAKPEPPKPPSTPPKRPAARLTAPPQAIKDATADVCRRVGDNRVDILASSGISPELFASTCYYDLLAMAKHESGFNCSAVGDGGRSRGCFQIQTALHGVSVAQAENYAFATEWTLDRMVRDLSYPRYRTAAIRRHNGAGDMAAAYASAVMGTSERMESQGL